MWPEALSNGHIFADDDYNGCRRDAAILLTHQELTARLVGLGQSIPSWNFGPGGSPIGNQIAAVLSTKKP